MRVSVVAQLFYNVLYSTALSKIKLGQVFGSIKTLKFKLLISKLSMYM